MKNFICDPAEKARAGAVLSALCDGDRRTTDRRAAFAARLVTVEQAEQLRTFADGE